MSIDEFNRNVNAICQAYRGRPEARNRAVEAYTATVMPGASSHAGRAGEHRPPGAYITESAPGPQAPAPNIALTQEQFAALVARAGAPAQAAAQQAAREAQERQRHDQVITEAMAAAAKPETLEHADLAMLLSEAGGAGMKSPFYS